MVLVPLGQEDCVTVVACLAQHLDGNLHVEVDLALAALKGGGGGSNGKGDVRALRPSVHDDIHTVSVDSLSIYSNRFSIIIL